MPQILVLAGDVNQQERADPGSAFTHVLDLLASADVLAGLATLDGAGIAHCHAGANLQDAHRPVVLERGGTRFGFLAYTSICWPFGMAAGIHTAGVASLRASTSYVPDLRSAEVPGRPPCVLTEPIPHELAAMVRDVEDLRARCDVLVVSCHWGVAGDAVCDYQRAIGRAAVDAGADLVMGHGPHTLQGIELHPVRRGQDNDVRPLAGDEAAAVLDHVAAMSAAFSCPGIADGLVTVG